MSIHGASPWKTVGERERNELRRAASLMIKKLMNMMGRRSRVTVNVIQNNEGVGDSCVKKELLYRCCETTSVVEEKQRKEGKKKKVAGLDWRFYTHLSSV